VSIQWFFRSAFAWKRSHQGPKIQRDDGTMAKYMWDGQCVGGAGDIGVDVILITLGGFMRTSQVTRRTPPPAARRESSPAVSIQRFPVRPVGEKVPPKGLENNRRRTMAKYMLIMRATDETMAAAADIDFETIMNEMGKYNDDMVQAGVLVAAEGLDDAAKGVVVDYSSQPPVVTDGPYGETKELFAGFWILDVASQEEAVEWAKRAPLAGPGSKVEIRRVAQIDEFPQDNEWIQKERAWRESTGQL
jgi:hypothetical protein